jgi:glycerophosphoryl diester phosphodiesterase
MKLNRKSCKLIAHRGLSSQAPENTIAAFLLASEAAYDGLECDIRETKDGEFVVFHDYSLDRMTGVSGIVSDFNTLFLSSLRITNGSNVKHVPKQYIPLLKEYLSICAQYQMIPVIEIKDVLNLESLNYFVQQLMEHKLYDTACVISFNLDYLVYLRQQYPDLNIQFLVNRVTDEVLELCKTHHFDLDINYQTVNQPLIETCHQAGILINVWTVDDLKIAQQLINSGVDFLTTNRLL